MKVSNTGNAAMNYAIQGAAVTGDSTFAGNVDFRIYLGGTCGATPTGTQIGGTTLTFANAGLASRPIAAGASETLCLWASPKDSGVTLTGNESATRTFNFNATYAAP